MKEDRIVVQCKSLVKLIERYIAKDIDDSDLKTLMPNITFSQIRILACIMDNEESIYQRDLENILNLRRATVSGILQTMERHNLIQRESCQTDARIKKIIITEKAKKEFLKQTKRMNELECILSSNIKSKDLKTFYNVISIMKNNLKELD